MTELSQKNENNIFITQWNHLNIFVTIEGIKTHHIKKSGRKSNWTKHFTPWHTMGLFKDLSLLSLAEMAKA